MTGWKVVVSFEVVEDGIKREVLSQLLGPCKLDYNPQGLAYYTFPEPIRNAVESSTVFARLRRDLLCQFRSKYALSLYELVQKRVNLRSAYRHNHFESGAPPPIPASPHRMG